MLAFKVHTMPFDIFAEFAGQPLWLWAAFLSFVGLVLWLDLGVINNHDGVISPARSAMMWGGFATCALVFAGYVYFLYEPDPAFYSGTGDLNAQATVQYVTGYLLETALAFDNIFVISMVFAFFFLTLPFPKNTSTAFFSGALSEPSSFERSSSGSVRRSSTNSPGCCSSSQQS